MNKLLSFVIMTFFYCNFSYALFLEIKCSQDEIRKLGKTDFQINWFASFKDKIGYKFDLKNFELLEINMGNEKQNLSLPIEIKVTEKEKTDHKEYNEVEILGTFASTKEIFVYKINLGISNNVNNSQPGDIKYLIYQMDMYSASAAALKGLQKKNILTYSGFMKWLGGRAYDPLIIQTRSSLAGSCDRLPY